MTVTDIESKFGVQVHRVVGLDGRVEYLVYHQRQIIRAPTLKMLALRVGMVLNK